MNANTYPPRPEQAHSRLDAERCADMQRRALEDNEGFWAEQGQRLDWIKPYHSVRDVSFAADDLRIRWYDDGALNACANCVDRHLPERGEQTAIIWEGDEPGNSRRISYRELHREVSRFANVLKRLGVKKGDRITIYLPMIPEAAYAMLACARIGAVHSVVFAGFSPEALSGRIADCESRMVITADEGIRGGRRVALKHNTDQAISMTPEGLVHTVLTVRCTGAEVDFSEPRDLWLHKQLDAVDDECPCEEMNAEDPLFILYTSGSTGKPKGVLHTTGGYLVYASMTHEHVFDCRPGEVFWCTADVGWVTGHSYIVYGPLCNGATTLMFEGVPNYPEPGRFWQLCESHRVSVFYTAPTAIRAMMREGDEPVRAHRRDSLRLLGSVGEPINPEAWEWYYRVVGEARCPIVDTWWQTETGGILISPLPGLTTLKPGSASRALFGIRPVIVDDAGQVLDGEASGRLALADSWPGQMRTVYGDHQRFVDTYFKEIEGMYLSGDGARRDADGDYWITGRVDDVLNVSGHRIGTAELESALVSHEAVAEAAVVGCPHEVKGESIFAFVELMHAVEPSAALRAALNQRLVEAIGPFAKADAILWAPDLPKTRSGKIMRRILRQVARGEFEDLGDTSTLTSAAVVEQLIAERKALA